MNFSIDPILNQKIRDFIDTNINTNFISKEEEIYINCKNKKLFFYFNNGIIESKLEFSDGEFLYKKQGEIVLNSKILLSVLNSLKNFSKLDFQNTDRLMMKISAEKFECNLVAIERKFSLNKLTFLSEKSREINLSLNFLNYVNTKFKDFYKSIGSLLQKNKVFSSINFKKKLNSLEIEVLLTDSYRVLFIREKLDLGVAFEFNLHTEILSCIVSLFKEFKEKKIEPKFFLEPEYLIIESENLFLKIKLLVSNYPNLSTLFESDERIGFSISKTLLLSAIERSLLLSEHNLNITLYKILGDILILEYRDSSKGFIREELEIKKIRGEDIKFSLNSYFLKQLLKNISDDEIVFSLSESFKPIILSGKKESNNFKQLIVPLKCS